MSKKKRDVSYSLYYWVIGVFGLILTAAFIMSFFIKEEFRLSPPIDTCAESSYLTSNSFVFPVDITYIPSLQQLLVVDSSAKTIQQYGSDGSLDFTLPGTFVSPSSAQLLPNGQYLVVDAGNLKVMLGDGAIVWDSSLSSPVLVGKPFDITSVEIINDFTYLIAYPNEVIKYVRTTDSILWTYTDAEINYIVDIDLLENDIFLVADKSNPSKVYSVNGLDGSRQSFSYTVNKGNIFAIDSYELQDETDRYIAVLTDNPVTLTKLSYVNSLEYVSYSSTTLTSPRDIIFLNGDFLVADSGNKHVVSVDCASSGAPAAVVGGPWTIVEGGTIEFDGSESYDVGGAIRSYTWTLDGTVIGTGSTLVYTTNKAPGMYTVTLTVTDNEGQTDTESNLLTISETIACGDTFTSGTHTLTSDLTCNSNGLIITGSDVTLDCDWHKLTGTSLNLILQDIGIWIKSTGTNPLERVTLKDCEITGFDTGLLLDNVDESSITNVYILDSNEFGMRLINSEDNLVSGGIRDGKQKGILLNHSNHNDLSFKQINRTREYYLELNFSDWNTIHNSKLESFDDDTVDFILLQNANDNQFNSVEMYVEGIATGKGVVLMDSDDNGFDHTIFENLAVGLSVLDNSKYNTFTSGDWMTNNTVDMHSDDAVTTILVDPDLIDPDTSKRTGTFSYDMDEGIFDVRWYLDLSSEDKNGDDLSGVDIGIYTKTNSPIYGKLSDSKGKVPLINITEYTIEEDVNDVDIVVYTPHTLSGYYRGVNYTSVKNISELGSFVFTFNVTANSNNDPDDDCTPNWICGDWGLCTNGVQTKICTDNNLCGTSTGMPLTSQGCTVSGQDPFIRDDGLPDYTSDPTQDPKYEGNVRTLDTTLIYYIIIPLLIVGVITFIIYWSRTRGGRKSTGFVVQSSPYSKDSMTRDEPVIGDEAKVYSFIREARSHGYTDDKIRDALLDKGWDPRIVDKTMQRRT